MKKNITVPVTVNDCNDCNSKKLTPEEVAYKNHKNTMNSYGPVLSGHIGDKNSMPPNFKLRVTVNDCNDSNNARDDNEEKK